MYPELLLCVLNHLSCVTSVEMVTFIPENLPVPMSSILFLDIIF